MVRVKGLEPSRLAARASKTRVSASFTIPATVIMLPYINLFVNSFYKFLLHLKLKFKNLPLFK